MGARHKLNQLYVVGSALFAGLFGLLAESWLVFLGVLMAFLALTVHGGDIRLQHRSHALNRFAFIVGLCTLAVIAEN